MYDWFDKLGIQADRFEYLGTPDTRPSRLIRAAPRILLAELELRKLPPMLENQTVLMSRSASPFSSGRIESLLLESAHHSVYDFDDAIYLGSRSWHERIWSGKKAWKRSVESADVVIAGSDVLGEAASRLRSDVRIIPSCVEPSNYLQKTSYKIQDQPRAIWIGSPATERFLTDLTDVLLALNLRHGLRLSVISSGNADLGALNAIVDRSDWDPKAYAGQLASADVGLMPLPDNDFTRGKCSYKLLQYGAAGLPVVGTPVGGNEVAIRRLGGLAPTTRGEWREALESIIEMSALERLALGNSGRAGVERHYSFDAWRTEWLRAMNLSPSRVMNVSQGEQETCVE
ncbi:glycosyltransferase family 1 protein [Cryobacterium sp. TmT2-59]|uniref:glycosyltransferase n=1 Tax=Cryobacterium sp. TmT2-59 TaxID=1259264 RepID=UPI00106AC875|nr:glycosyltransferase [Cryobacterium sp. TmT2-59]TFC89818.1 glycosyltransferase family 1 protein [Cryobacterium sp. TmT2-59]